MFNYLSGTIAEIGNGFVVIDVGGVGFGCNASLQTLSKLKVGAVSKLHTHLNVREDALELFAFYDSEELEMFKLLVSISGVGPKVALSILSVAEPSVLILAVTTGDDKPILAANGVGKKLAGRILLELQDKVKKSSVDIKEFSKTLNFAAVSDSESEAVEALSSLGYGRAEISAALAGAELSGMETEDIIKLALARLMR